MKRLFLIALLCLTACTSQEIFNRLASPDEQTLAVEAANELRSSQVNKIAEHASPDVQQHLPSFAKFVIPSLVNVPGPFILKSVNSTKLYNGPTTKTFIFQAGQNDHWALVQITLQTSKNSNQIIGLWTKFFDTDPSKISDFNIGGRGWLGYVFLTMMFACCVTCIGATILIWRRRWLTRRWLWTLGSLFGFAGFGLNWSTGAWGVGLNISLLGAQATKAGPFAPWFLSFGFPLVALIVIARWHRRNSIARLNGRLKIA